MTRRALVSSIRLPTADRDYGSQKVDLLVRYLVEDGWRVTFLAAADDADRWHAQRLRQLGVATYVGLDAAADVIAAGGFDLALLAYWEPAAKLLPLLAELSPDTRVVVSTIDVHFLREARRRFATATDLDARFGEQLVQELNTYRAADAVLAVSASEAQLLAGFLNPERVHHLPVPEPMVRSRVPRGQRRGILFVGNFRHLPNGEAVEHLCRDVVPRLDPELLAAHPLSVVGNGLGDSIRRHAAGIPGIRMVGWVPSVVPYLEGARVCAVPLLHGAGVKGKTIQALASGTPVVTTPIGAEGLDLVHGRHALVAQGADAFASALTLLLTDAKLWRRLATAGPRHIAARHGSDLVHESFRDIVEGVLQRPRSWRPGGGEGSGSGLGSGSGEGGDRSRRHAEAYRAMGAALRATLERVTDPGSTVLVVSRGDGDLVALPGRAGRHFPQGADGEWAGYHPADSESALHHLETLRQRGARYLAFPATSFWWLHHYRELAVRLDRTYRRIHADEHVIVFELRERDPTRPWPASEDGARRRVRVIGRYDPARTGPPSSLVAALGASRRFAVTQDWTAGLALVATRAPSPAASAAPAVGREAESGQTATSPVGKGVATTVAGAAGSPPPAADPAAPVRTGDADWVVRMDDRATVPAGFLDEFLPLLDELGVDRGQPTHAAGPGGGPPIGERLRGCVAREVAEPVDLPVLAVRTGASADGPVTLVDAVPIGLTRPYDADQLGWASGDPAEGRPPSPADGESAPPANATLGRVLDVHVTDGDELRRGVRRSGGTSDGPRISVLVATFDRPGLLDGCLAGFAEQTLERSAFEVVVVDDGSPGPETAAVLERWAAGLPLVWVRIDHAGRAAAKNLAAQLARSEIVLFADDDDRPAPTLLDEHLRGHAAHPGDATAVLGHTDWAPELEVTPFMRFVTEVDRVLFSYGSLRDGQRLDWQGFWEGRVSCKRALLRHGLHDQRLAYSIDIELAWRLGRHGLGVVYHPAAKSWAARPVALDDFGDRIEAKGRALAAIVALHPDEALRRYARLDRALDAWPGASELAAAVARAHTLEAELADAPAVPDGSPAASADAVAAPDPRLDELYRTYRAVLAARYARGLQAAADGQPAPLDMAGHGQSGATPTDRPAPPTRPPGRVQAKAVRGDDLLTASAASGTAGIAQAGKDAAPASGAGAGHRREDGAAPGDDAEGGRPTAASDGASGDGGGEEDGGTPALTVTIPVWSVTSELADMAMRTVERVWEVARLPTEVVVVDNGSPHSRPLRARVHRFGDNQGVARGWNTGISLARAPVVAVLNSDCRVEPGWDEALHEAATDGRRIAFPYTDHGDGLGFRQPDQAGTAGWCFAMSVELYREIGAFDESFTPAFCEDTDYWHRAWELGVELAPVPAARVVHARRTTNDRADANNELLLQAHRYKYGWKHGVDPHRAPPFYKRTIVEYRGRRGAEVTSA